MRALVVERVDLTVEARQNQSLVEQRNRHGCGADVLDPRDSVPRPA
jgi:hypothetical protein